MEEPIMPVEVFSLLDRHLPVETAEVSLAAVPEESNADVGGGDIRVVFRLIIWDIRDGDRTIRDIKEQECVVVWAASRSERHRLEAYVLGWTEALRRAFEERGAAGFEIAMPSDVVMPDLLKLRKPKTVTDFEQAALQPNRLGSSS